MTNNKNLLIESKKMVGTTYLPDFSYPCPIKLGVKK